MKRAIAIISLAILSACGSDPPTSVNPDPPVPPPPAVDVAWDELAKVFRDPLYIRLPRVLEDQQAAAPLNAAVASLAAAITGENLDLVRQELSEIALLRAAYLSRPDYEARDRPLLLAMELMEMQGKVYVPAEGEAGITTSTQGGGR